MTKIEALKNIRHVLTPGILRNYLGFQMELAMAKIKDLKSKGNPSYRFVPPARLRMRVHGSLDTTAFMHVGKVTAQNIRELSIKAGRDIYSCERILDFGCGSGRVIASFEDSPGSCLFHGSDIDSELIAWCNKNIPDAKWNTNGQNPPLAYESNYFDLIFSVGVFTNLDEKSEMAWLAELQRVANSGAVVILSVYNQKNAPESARRKIDSNGFVFLSGETGRRKADDIPYFYHRSFHTKEYIMDKWSEYFKILDYVELGINNDQDVVIMQKR